MQINIKTTIIELTPALRGYVEDKLEHLSQIVSFDSGALVDVEVGKTTQHHKAGEFFRAELTLMFQGESFRVETEEEDLYAAIDVAKDSLEEEVKKYMKRRNTLIRKGGRLFKNIIRGFYRRK